MPPRAPRRTEGSLPQSSAQAGTASGPQGCIAAPPLCGDTTRLPLQRGCIVAASALAGIHHGCLRTPTYCIICSPLSSNKAGMPHGFLPGWGDASWMPPLFQGPHFLQNSPLLAQALSTGTAPPRAQCQPHTVEIEVATRARSIEASDCDLRPFPDPSAPLGIEWWLRSQRASAPPRANAKAPLALQHELEKAQRCTELGCITGTSTNVGMHRGYLSSFLCAAESRRLLGP